VNKVREDLRRGASIVMGGFLRCGRGRKEGGEDAEEGCVGVDVVEGGAVVDLRVVIQDMSV